MTDRERLIVPIHYATPLHPMRTIGQPLGIDLWVKRDDLTPIPGGGAKLRKLARILGKISPETTAIVTTGGVQSNHARTTSLLAAQLKLHCELILHGEEDALRHPRGNLLLMLLSGARVSVVSAEKIADGIHDAMNRLREDGHVPALIAGGGHSTQGAMGLVDALLEVDAQRPTQDWVPDYIVHASGTGGTQAGLLAGLDVLGWPTHVIGISVARTAERGRAVVTDLYEQLRDELELNGKARDVEVWDDWVGDGYGQALSGTDELIEEIASLEGLPLDPTYTSKAMRGLIGLVTNGTIGPRSKVLFWHTGGLLNLLSSNMEWRFDQ